MPSTFADQLGSLGRTAWDNTRQFGSGVLDNAEIAAADAWTGLKDFKNWAPIAGTTANAGMNAYGMFDNNKVLMQLLGLAGGTAIPLMAGMTNPLGIANIAMGAGNLGALFDRLRAGQSMLPFTN